jgi:hypothetical protein
MTAEEVYTKAAELVANGDEDYSCLAIHAALGNGDDGCLLAYKAWFSPASQTWGGSWWRGPGARNCRVIALLLMAQVARTE